MLASDRIRVIVGDRGPVIEYPGDATVKAIEAAVPRGWRVAWTEARRIINDRYEAPLISETI